MAYPVRRAYDENFASNFVFKRPPEAPVFEPTYEEFQNPIEYISKIREQAEKVGICKIKPPPDWQPPFAVDVDKFKFVPRVQKLNELEAKTRVKLNFLDQIAKFWQLQGIPLKIPVVEKRTLDLYDLFHFVRDAGGLQKLDKDRKWFQISNKMGFEANKGLPQVLRTHYVKILNPFEVFRKLKLEKAIKTEVVKDEVEEVKIAPKRSVELIDLLDEDDDDDDDPKKLKIVEDDDSRMEMEGKEYTPHDLINRPLVKPAKGSYSRRAGNCYMAAEVADGKDGSKTESVDGVPANKELARLAFFGAGPKLPGYDPQKKSCQSKTRGKKVTYSFDPLDKYSCKTCLEGDKEDKILICDDCDDGYHMHCLIPPLLLVPEGDWRCPQCLALEVSKPVAAFGFDQSPREYTLQQFGDMADNFKKNYFRQPVYAVPPEVVEREFWRVVSCIDEDVTVQYGADLHTMDHGSGFPTYIDDAETMAMELEYATSPWNLNNLPVCEGSVLQFIDSDISGMKVPWMYVGMCFATFCWHNEDHWNYSINYLHWGEPKTWYGVPGAEANLLEETMRSVAPELFTSQPDLLQQLVTLMNPNYLMERKVKVVRTDQQAGEFVVTFPRAYHAGFNQGYNFAEAVNFAPAEWIPLGRQCIEHYSSLRRYCVFSHDELIIGMAQRPECLDAKVALLAYNDLIMMVNCELTNRKIVCKWGVNQTERFQFEDLKDDDRLCEVCKTTCYLSGVTCECQAGSLKHTCIKHFAELCSCPPHKHTLRFRHELNELLAIIKKLKSKTIKN